MEFERSGYDDVDLADYARLFSACFPGARKLADTAYLRWLYVDNPAGPVVGFNAREGGRLAAHYACIPMLLDYEGEPRRALLSLNTATHPDFQGRGLFTRLAELTYEAGGAEGARMVYGVANANSTPGFLRKLGFGQVGQLESRLGMGSLGRYDWSRVRQARFALSWPQSHLEWRLGNPANAVRVVRMRDGSVGFEADSGRAMVKAWAQLPGRDGLAAAGGIGVSPRIWLGLMPAGTGRFGFYPQLPDRLRPSPLNLIVRGLDGPVSLDCQDVFFSFLDFDAF